MPCMQVRGQFRPYGVSGRIVDVVAYQDHAVTLSSIYEKGYSLGGSDSGDVTGVFVGLIRGGNVDTAVRWLAVFDRYASWGIEPHSLSETSSGLFFGYYNTSDVGRESLNFWRLADTHDSIQNYLLEVPVSTSQDGIPHVQCSDSIVIEVIWNGQCVKWRSKNSSDTDKCNIGFPLDWTFNKVLFSNGLWLMNGCDVESSVSLSTPAITSTVHFNTPDLLVGWTGKQGCWSTDDGQTWTVSDSLDWYDDSLHYMYHHTTDGYDVIAEWDGRYRGTMNARIYIKPTTDNSWSVYSIPNSYNVKNIYGDSLSNMYIAFDNYFLLTYNIYPPNLWKYDPAVSVDEPLLKQSRIPDLARSKKLITRNLSALNHEVSDNGAWFVYTGMGEFIMGSVYDRQSLPEVPRGLYLVIQHSKVFVVLVTD
ncbi:MAG: hypothetical protein HYX66_04370 [Ignavibacteria bacterium]|nr:hypothetical protein [Ignavibacteria bacterium]